MIPCLYHVYKQGISYRHPYNYHSHEVLAEREPILQYWCRYRQDNGNINCMTSKAGDESIIRGYKFTYDGLNRMLNATYGEDTNLFTNP